MRRIERVGWIVLALVMTLGGPAACDSGDGEGGGSGNATTFELRSEGKGEAFAAADFLPTTGSRVGQYMVRAYRFSGEDYVQLTEANERLAQRGWLKLTDAGLLEVGNIRYGLYPKARMLIPAEGRAGMSWFTSPWGLDDDRIVKNGENPEGDNPGRNGEEASFAPSEVGPTAFGWKKLWHRSSDLSGADLSIWTEGAGFVGYTTSGGGVSLDAVLLDEDAPRPEPGPTVALQPAMDDSLFVDCFRPSGLSVLQREDGDLQVVLSGAGLLQKIMVGTGGGDSVYLPEPASLCYAVGPDGWRELGDSECVGASRVLVREDGSHVTIPQERIEYHDAFGNILDVKYVPHGALVEQDGALIHLTDQRVDECDRGPCPDPEVRVVTYPDGSHPSGGPWLFQTADDGRRVFEVGGAVATWDGEAGFSSPWRGPRVDQYHLRNTAAGHELFHVTADGRLREVLLRPDGVEYRALAQLDLPDRHIATAAVRLDGQRFLVFTHTGDLGYTPQMYQEPEVGYEDYLEWRIENYWVEPDFGEAHLWIAEIPESDEPRQLPPISQTMTITPHERHLELCWPPVYGAGETEGWTLEGHEPFEVLWDDERSCLLVVRHPNRVAAVNVPGAFWAHGPLPTAGPATMATGDEGADDGWNATTVTDRIHGTDLFTAEDLAVVLGSFQLSGTNPRLTAGLAGGWYYDGDEPSSLNSPDDPPDSPDTWAGAQVVVDRGGVESQWMGGVGPDDGNFVPVFYLGPHEPRDFFSSAGVQGGGILFQDTIESYWDAYDEDRGYGRGWFRFIEPPELPSPDTEWRHEVMLTDRTLCGHLGGDTLYCTDGAEQRELSGVARVHPRQWWVTEIAPEPEGGVCPANFETVDCPNGRVWLLGADAAHPEVTLFDPATMTVTDYALADALPGFPEAPTELRIETVHSVINFEARKTEIASPVGLVGAATPDGPRYWLVRFGPDQPEVFWGPRHLELPEDLAWAAQVQAKALPRLRPAQFQSLTYNPGEAFLVISHVLGDVTDYVVNTPE